MVKRYFFNLVVIGIISILFLLNIFFVSATVNYYSLNLSSDSYSQGQQLNGGINLTLLNQDSGVPVQYFIDNGLIGSMTLLDFINKSGIGKTCDLAGCNKKYSIVSSSGTENLINSAIQNGTIKAFYITGENIQIKDFSFDIAGKSVDSTERCFESAFKIDLLNDGILEYEYKEPGNNPCSLGHAGENFSASVNTDKAYIVQTPLCEKIKIAKTGGVEISSLLTFGEGYVLAFIYDTSFNELGNCTMWDDGTGKHSCMIDSFSNPNFFINEEKYYYVCLSNSQSTGSNDYQIITESSPPYSGFISLNNPPQYNIDFAIYVKEFTFLPFNEVFTFNNESTLNSNLVQYIQSYVSSKYSNNCSSGCVIPIQFLVNDLSQKINITAINLRYNKGTPALTVSTNKIYDVTTTWPKINVSNQLVNFAFLNVTADMAPSTTSHIFKLLINNISKQDTFKVENTPQVISLLPLQATPGQSTTFNVYANPINAVRPIVSYKWNFGDGSGEQITYSPTTTHTYTNTTDYTVTITVTDNQSISGSKTFIVSTNLSYALVNVTLNNKINQLNAFASALGTQDLWYSVLYNINITEKNQILQGFRTQFNSTTPMQQLLLIKTQLDSINIPGNITETYRLQESPYFPSPDYIYPEDIAKITGTETRYDLKYEDDYKNLIALWEENNVDLRISGSTKAIDYSGSTEEKVTLFTVSIDPIESDGFGLGETFFVLKLPAGVSYNNLIIKDKDSFDTVDLNDAVGFSFESLSNKQYIYFAMPGKQDLNQITLFASPALSEFTVSDDVCTGDACKIKGPPWALIIFVIILIVAAIGAALFFIWKGHMPVKNKEEDLFKNKNDLYTLTSYISSNISRGINKEVIVMQLMKAGWSKEQIDYAFKKSKK